MQLAVGGERCARLTLSLPPKRTVVPGRSAGNCGGRTSAIAHPERGVETRVALRASPVSRGGTPILPGGGKKTHSHFLSFEWFTYFLATPETFYCRFKPLDALMLSESAKAVHLKGYNFTFS